MLINSGMDKTKGKKRAVKRHGEVMKGDLMVHFMAHFIIQEPHKIIQAAFYPSLPGR